MASSPVYERRRLGQNIFSAEVTCSLRRTVIVRSVLLTMGMTLQEQYDDAMFDFSRGDFDGAIGKLKAVLAADPAHFDSQLALGMAYYRQGNFALAITEGHKAEALRPKEQLVHTNLSLFYMKSGDRQKAEHHGLKAKIESWRADAGAGPSGAKTGDTPELRMARPKPPPTVIFPSQPWKKKS
ncbi:MAG TPA: tetratricopeptide repeat protein [Verrucomicrobiae bacterium]|nr:tetratricopeptide repeat protein [Verrucomicrobiae bacterium]